MVNKILAFLLIFILTGCVNKESAEKALQDPITFNLVKQSIGDDVYQPFSNYGVDAEYVHNYYLMLRSHAGSFKFGMLLFN